MPFLLLAASLFAATSKAAGWLRSYLWMATGLALAETILLTAGTSIASNAYGFTWMLFNVCMAVCAIAYTWESLNGKWIVLLVAVIPNSVFLSNGTPDKWYLWLSAGKGAIFGTLGIALFICGGYVNHVLGAYWILTSAFQYAFTRFDGRMWSLNEWVPSALSVSALMLIGCYFRMKPSAQSVSS